jgi:hypothetical protein
MVRLLEELVTEKRALEAKMELLLAQNKTLETHLIELKIAVVQQKEIPAQVMLRRPVVLIDAFEENRLPFHLEFINSFEALFAVFMVRFKDRGQSILDKIRLQWFDMVETSRERRIDFEGPWAKAFLVRVSACSCRIRIVDRDLAWAVCRDEYACSCVFQFG